MCHRKDVMHCNIAHLLVVCTKLHPLARNSLSLRDKSEFNKLKRESQKANLVISLQSSKMAGRLELKEDKVVAQHMEALFGDDQANFLTQVNSIQCTMDISTMDLVAAQGL